MLKKLPLTCKPKLPMKRKKLKSLNKLPVKLKPKNLKLISKFKNYKPKSLKLATPKLICKKLKPKTTN